MTGVSTHSFFLVMPAEIKKFCYSYRDTASGQMVFEEPRLVVSDDSTHKSLSLSLWFGKPTILATVPIDEDDVVLWKKALDRLEAILYDATK